MKNMDMVTSYAGTAVAGVLAGIGENLGSWIATALAIVSAILTIVYTGLRIWKWAKDAMKDGKIDSDEIDEAIDIIKEAEESLEGEADNGEDK